MCGTSPERRGREDVGSDVIGINGVDRREKVPKKRRIHGQVWHIGPLFGRFNACMEGRKNSC
jgi:hypothetical protein